MRSCFTRSRSGLRGSRSRRSLTKNAFRLVKKLAEFGDPRPGVGLCPDGLPDIAWVEIPPGSIELKNVKHDFEVNRFHMAKYLVTNVQFKAFTEDKDGYRDKRWWKGIQHVMKAPLVSRQEANAPRDRVSWYEAVAFCRWLSHRTGSMIRLPTEWEWQQAASGGDPTRDYPWLGKWDEARCNSGESRLDQTVAVGMYPRGATQQGVLDMTGNLWEWCLNTYAHPESPESLHINTKDAAYVSRGGSWFNPPEFQRVSYRNRYDAGSQNNYIGFRLVQDIEK
ncbi:MAG: formylglycine-generating enzyme family protein [Nitrospira sp.]|nr:MAG: formylglycine-generating enzyme family protein [Nitrospira sp.]